jgi:hypothetical protein
MLAIALAPNSEKIMRASVHLQTRAAASRVLGWVGTQLGGTVTSFVTTTGRYRLRWAAIASVGKPLQDCHFV